jgi:hypothetical protein
VEEEEEEEEEEAEEAEVVESGEARLTMALAMVVVVTWALLGGKSRDLLLDLLLTPQPR